jgi:hypothetical protein
VEGVNRCLEKAVVAGRRVVERGVEETVTRGQRWWQCAVVKGDLFRFY